MVSAIIILVMNMATTLKRIGSRIAQLRKEQNYTQVQFGKKVNISPTHISTVENGGSYSLNTLLTICDGLDTTLDYVLYGNLRTTDKENLKDIINICNDYEVSVLLSVAKSLIDNRKNSL